MSYLGYPSIPLVGFWDDTQTYTIEPLEMAITEGGLISRSPRNAINRLRHGWNVSGNVTNGIELNNFLRDRLNMPFAFAHDGIEANELLYTCNEWDLQLLSYTPGNGKSIFKFSGKFNQQFRASIVYI